MGGALHLGDLSVDVAAVLGRDLHLLDLRESIRQALVLELPMAPICREDCPGLPEAAGLGNDGDDRLAVLSRLLVNSNGDANE